MGKGQDANSRLFHRVASSRHRKSLIKELELDGGSISRDIGVIASEISSFYTQLFTEDLPSRPFIKDLDWCLISLDKTSWLERPFGEEEIRKAVFSLGRDKAPSPNSFTFAFFQNYWDIVKIDLPKVFNEFFLNGKLKSA